MKKVNPTGCDYEPGVVRAVRTGIWSDELREHAGHCYACGEAMAVAGFLLSEEVPAVPEAGLMWWKLELRARRERAARAMRPLMIAERAAACLLGGALLGGILWLGSFSSALGLVAAAAAGVLGVSAGSAILLASSRK